MRKKIIQIPIPEELLETVDRYSQAAGKSRAAFIREACADYVARSEEAEKDRRYVESYRQFPENVSEAEDKWRVKNAIEVWGEEDWSDWEEATK